MATARALLFGSICCFLPAIAIHAADAASERQIPRWQPEDLAFSADAGTENPFTVDFWAEGRCPDGSQRRLLGYYSGQGKWTIRIAPDTIGRWSLTTHSKLPALEGKTVTFTCIANPNPHVHGGLLVDEKHRHHFIYEDGTHYFPLGYECDWLWALDVGLAELKTIDPFLDKLSRYGFNFVILDTYAHDTSWRKGRTGPDDFGPPPIYAWEGTNAEPDHSRFNPVFWQHYDRVINALYRRGMIAHVLIKVYNKQVHWPAVDSAEDERFFRWLVARYAAYPNVVWDFAKEAHNEKNLDYKLKRLKFIREYDPYHRLLTIHDDKKSVAAGVFDGTIDFITDQQHSKWHETILKQRNRRDWPIINAEFGYEPGSGGVNDKTYRVAQPTEEVLRRAWEISMAGGYTACYYTYTAWDVIRPSDTPPGYAMFKHLRDFFERTQYWLLEPSDPLVSDGYCLATPGKQYVVYQNKARPLTLKVSQAAGALEAHWFQPASGETKPAGTLHNGENTLTPPAEWSDRPIAMYALEH